METSRLPASLRSSQIDAAELDEEFAKLLKEQVLDLGFLGVDFRKFKPELDLLFDLIVNYSILTSGQTYGLMLENLVYKSSNHKPMSKRQIVLYAFVRVITTWGWTRFQSLVNSLGWSEKASSSWKFKFWKLLQRLEVVLKGLSFINFAVFLRNGRFRTLTDRLLGITLVYDQPRVNRMINFEFMNQQLVWQAFTEFFVTLLPLLNVTAWKRKLKSIFDKKRNAEEHDESLCMICILEERIPAVIQLPYITNCNHVFCYYCVKSELMANSAYCCPRCNTHIHSIEPKV